MSVAGKLSKAQISQGYEILQRISAVVEEIEELTTIPVQVKATKACSKSRRKRKAKAKGPVATTSQSLTRPRDDLKTLPSEFTRSFRKISVVRCRQ